MSDDCFYVQPFKWEGDVEREFKDRNQVIHCWGKVIPAKADGTPLTTKSTKTCLLRVRGYPAVATVIVPPTYTLRGKTFVVRESEVREIMRYFESWHTTPQGMRAIDPDGYASMKSRWGEMLEFFESEYGAEHAPTKITFEKRRRVYYYKRLPDGQEREDYVINVHFRNTTVARKFIGASGFMASMYIDNKKMPSYVKNISNKTYAFEVGFRDIDSVQKLITERKVTRCGWFFVRDATLVKPAERVCPRGSENTWGTVEGGEIKIDTHVPEYFVSNESIIPADPNIVCNLRSVPSVVSWDIECYSDNHKAMPVPWIGRHVVYVITAVYQWYGVPSSRIRRAFVLGKCGDSPEIIECKSEMELIDSFTQFIEAVNPDILLGYNVYGFDIRYLDARLQRNNRGWANMGRLRENITVTKFTEWNSSAYGKNQLYSIEAPGRMCEDMMKIIERDYKFSDYKLETVSNALLGKGKNDVSPQEMFRIYEMYIRRDEGCEAELRRVVEYGIQDAILPLELFEKINGWPFFIESANVMCVNPSELFTRGQQTRLINQFYDKCFHMGFVIDNRKTNVITAEGAYVVPPIKGMHENVMTLDFASLYPSIMIAHNIGHDTLVLDETIPDEECHVFEWTDEESGNFEKDNEFNPEDAVDPNAEEQVQGNSEYKIRRTDRGTWRFRFIREDTGHRSIMATMLVDLLAARKAVRVQQKKVKETDPTYWDILEQRQKAIKVSCNSVYGMTLAQMTGKLPLAEGGICVTYRGRQLNMEMQRLAKEQYGAVTVYGDTDSVMIKTPYTGLMTEAAKRFGGRKPTEREISVLAAERGIDDYSPKIAERFLEHYGGHTREYEVCSEMGDHIARDISSHLPRPISLEFENVFVVALFLMKKRYACIVLDRENMVVKAHPQKMYTKGVMLARRDNCAWARDTFRDTLFNILMGKSRVETSLIIHEHVHRLLTWRVPMTDLEVIQKLGFDYKADTFPLKLFSEHLADIGKPARPNDRLAFIIATAPNSLAGPDPKLGHYYRLTETLKEEISDGRNSVDYIYYLGRLENDLNQIFSVGFGGEIEGVNEQRRRKIFSELHKQREELVERISEAEGAIPQSDKKQIVQLNRKIKAYAAVLKKIDTRLTILEKKGVEEYDKKARGGKDVISLRLDEKMYRHVLDHIRGHRLVMEEIRQRENALKE